MLNSNSFHFNVTIVLFANDIHCPTESDAKSPSLLFWATLPCQDRVRAFSKADRGGEILRQPQVNAIRRLSATSGVPKLLVSLQMDMSMNGGTP